jgi:hypothetical protein
MTPNILDPRLVLDIISNNGILLLHPSIENLDFSVGETGGKDLGRSNIADNASDGTVRIGIQVLGCKLRINMSLNLVTTYQGWRLGLSVPYFDDPRVSANEKDASRLLPVHHNASTLPDWDEFRKAAEGTDHLDRSLVNCRIVVSVQTKHAIG